MRHLIMGTAGHIDHGKTALIQALTGIDCDTHAEEKRRGITINLGFAHLKLPSGDTVGIVDVPGHKGFVHTMVAGASGVDFALLVIAADSGVMPQTREHLQIMEVLGIRTGLIAMTKIDLVDSDILTIAHEEAVEFTKDTFLENCLIVRVSSRTKEGIEDLRKAIVDVSASVSDRVSGEMFRMFIDRIFSVSGFGTVVTGSVLSGTLHVEDTTWLLPGEEELRVRRLERHGQLVDSVTAGDRASMNLVGLNRDEFQRGMIVSDRLLHSTQMIDAQLHLFKHSRPFAIWSQVIFLLGTYEVQARMHCVDRNEVFGGETTLVQIHLPRPLVVQSGDRFVIRSTSSDMTLGGGEVIDASPLHHRRRPPELVDNLRKIAHGKLPELVASEVRKRYAPVSHPAIADMLNVSAKQVAEVVSAGLPEDIISFDHNQTWYLVPVGEHRRLRDEVVKAIATFHRRNPLVEEGRTPPELLGMLGIDQHSDGEVYLRMMLEALVSEGILKKVKHTYAAGSHTAAVSPQLKKQIGFVEKSIQGTGMQVPLMSQLTAEASRSGIEERTLRQILRYLVGSRRAYAVEDSYIHASIVDTCRAKLFQALSNRPEGMTVAQFRDLVQGNRKMCLLLLNIYDSEGVTRREGDLRVITEKGLQLISRK